MKSRRTTRTRPVRVDAVTTAKVDSNKEPSVASQPLIQFRPYQKPVFMDRATGVQVLHWSRQIGKSYTLAAWAVDRLLTRPGRLVTILSNSRANGQELNLKCAEVCQKLGAAFDQEDLSSDIKYENMNMETRITVNGKVGRIKVLAANARTARGFSGDLILDEFAFHEDSQAIWEAAEPILSSNPDFLCRIASTGNGKRNMFYRMVTGGQFPVVRVTRSMAYEQGVKIYHQVTRAEITPAQARELSLDKRAYDQNYECAFEDENMALLTHELISAAEVSGIGIVCNQTWSSAALDLFNAAKGDLYLGQDVGRYHDLSVQAVFEKISKQKFLRGLLRMRDMRLPQQQEQLGLVCGMPKFRCAHIDMTGIGLGLTEYAQDKFGFGRVIGVNFSSTVPLTKNIARDGRKAETVKVTEAMAVDLLQTFEDRTIKIMPDPELRDDLRKPEKVVSAGGRVSIAATRDAEGHADNFWAIALGNKGAETSSGPFAYKSIGHYTGPLGSRSRIRPTKGILV